MHAHSKPARLNAVLVTDDAASVPRASIGRAGHEQPRAVSDDRCIGRSGRGPRCCLPATVDGMCEAHDARRRRARALARLACTDDTDREIATHVGLPVAQVAALRGRLDRGGAP